MKKKTISLTFFTVLLVFAVIYFFRQPLSGFFVDLTSPVSASISAKARGIKKSFNFFFHIRSLRKENTELSTKLTELEIDRSKITELETENKLLKRELGFLEESKKGSLIPANITEQDPISFLDTITLNRGRDYQIEAGMAVIANGALVGQVKEVFERSCRVVLITSKDSIVQAMLQDSRAKGILKGGISGLYLENIPPDTEFKPKEYVITSGLGGRIKQGIVIGRAASMQTSSSGIFKSISLESIVNFTKLEMVFIQK